MLITFNDNYWWLYKRSNGYTPWEYLTCFVKIYEFEGNSFYCNVPRVVNFDMSCEFSIEDACHSFRERLFKECLYTHVSLKKEWRVIHCQWSGKVLNPVTYNTRFVIIKMKVKWFRATSTDECSVLNECNENPLGNRSKECIMDRELLFPRNHGDILIWVCVEG